MFWKRKPKAIERAEPSCNSRPWSPCRPIVMTMPADKATEFDLGWTDSARADREPVRSGRRVHRTTWPDEGTYWGEIREEAPGEWRARIMVKNGSLIAINQVLQRTVPKDAALIWVDQRLDAIAGRDAGWTPA